MVEDQCKCNGELETHIPVGPVPKRIIKIAGDAGFLAISQVVRCPQEFN
jgi:hypothetical protein